MRCLLICIVVFNILPLSFAFADGDHGESNSVGEGKAIVDVLNDGKRFKLADKAIKILDLKYEKISFLNNETFEISKKSLVRFGEKFGLFIIRDGWFELVDVEVKFQKNSKVGISSKKLQKSDQIVVSGVALLRLAQLEASGEGGEGH